MFRLIPREEKFYEMFYEAAENIYQAAKLLTDLMENFKDPAQRARQIKELESIGDNITHQIIQKLNKTFVTPFDREDIHALTSALDDVLDWIEAASDRLVLFHLSEPPEEAGRLAHIILKSAEEIVKGIQSLRNINNVLRHCVEINRLENEADSVFREALARLFENGRDPITIIKLKEVYEDLEVATDRCEDVANVLESIAVKHQ